MDFRIVRRNTDSSDIPSMRIPFGLVLEWPIVVVHDFVDSQIRIEECSNPYQCVPRRLGYGDWMSDRVVVNLVKELGNVSNAWVWCVHTFAVEVIECVRRDRAIHIRDDSISKLSAIVTCEVGHVSGRMAVVTERPPKTFHLQLL